MSLSKGSACSRRLLHDRDFTTRICEIGVDPFPAREIQSCDLLIVLGGPIGVYETDAYPWLVEETAAIGERLRVQKPTLGICLGAQLMAAALGAKVAPGPAKEIGYAPLSLTDEGRASPLAALDGVLALHWHGDAFDLPTSAKRLAFTDVCPNQAFSLGETALALQFHAEVETGLARSLADRAYGRTRQGGARSARLARAGGAPRRGDGGRGQEAVPRVARRSVRMSVETADLAAAIAANMPELRGRLAANQPLAPFTWFRVGGPAEVLFSPADEADLSYFLKNLPPDVPVTTIGLGSNLIVRDGGVEGMVIRLGGKAFGEIAAEGDCRLRAGACALDVRVAKRGGGSRNRRPGLFARHSGLHRRRLADERRRAWRRDQGRARFRARRRPQRRDPGIFGGRAEHDLSP